LAAQDSTAAALFAKKKGKKFVTKNKFKLPKKEPPKNVGTFSSLDKFSSFVFQPSD
jgi:hypothetical protein